MLKNLLSSILGTLLPQSSTPQTVPCPAVTRVYLATIPALCLFLGMPRLDSKTNFTMPDAPNGPRPADFSMPVRVYSDLAETMEVGGYSTIQAAINDGTTLSGYVVRVDAGTYNENLTVSGKNLIFRGPNAGLNDANGARVAEAVLTAASNTSLIVLASNVSSYTIDGFKLVGADYTNDANGSIIWASGTNTVSNILNNLIELTSTTTTTKRYIWLGGSSSGSSGTLYISGNISHNTFTAAGPG